MAVKVDQQSFEEQVLRAAGPVLAEFYTDGCTACRMLSPVLAELEEEHQEQLKIVKINAGSNAALAGQYQVTSAPALLYFTDGREQWRQTGFVDKAGLEKLLDI